MRPGAMAAALLAAAALPALARAQRPRPAATWDSVAAVLGTPAVPAAGYVRFDLPRRDLTVRMGDVTLAVPLAGEAWVGFAGEPRDATVIGDLLVTAAELEPVEAELLRGGFEITAIHDPLVGETPRLVGLRVAGRGPAVLLARGLDAALARTGTPRPVTAAVEPPVTIDTAVVAAALGPGARAHGSVAQYAVALADRRVRWRGRTLPPGLALATTLDIQALHPTRAVATGDLALLDRQVQPVLRALAAHGIVAEALGGRLADTSPAVSFVGVWADGTLRDVVRGLAAALDAARAAR